MNTYDEKTKPQNGRGKHWARRTHRAFAMASLIFLILIALSGLILNHADFLGLSKRHASGALMLRIYGIEAPPIDVAFEARGMVFATAASMLFADGILFANDASELRGAVANNNGMVIATANEFFITTPDAVLVERFVPEISQALSKLGTDGNRMIAAIDDRVFEFDADRVSLTEVDRNTIDNVRWSEPTMPDSDLQLLIGEAALGQSLNWERVLVDLHSGRILPTVGRYVADLVALSLLYLSMTGVLLWLRRR